jgi:hypothetical protein
MVLITRSVSVAMPAFDDLLLGLRLAQLEACDAVTTSRRWR